MHYIIIYIMYSPYEMRKYQKSTDLLTRSSDVFF